MEEDEYEDEGEWEDDEFEDWEEFEEGEEEEEEEDGVPQPGAIPAEATTWPYTEGQFVDVGTITKAFGIRGEVKIAHVTDQPHKRFARGKRLWLQPPAPRGPRPRGGAALPLQRLTVESSRVIRPELKGRPGSEVWGVKFAELPDRTAAEKVAQWRLLLAVCDRERLRTGDEFFIQDLVGLKVFNHRSGALVGLVTEVYDGTGTFSTLRVRLAPSRADVAASIMRTTLLPFAAEVVPKVDIAAGRMEIDPPEGLLDNVVRRKLKSPYTPEQAAKLIAQIEEEEKRLAAGGGGGGGVAASPTAAAGGGGGGGKQG